SSVRPPTSPRVGPVCWGALRPPLVAGRAFTDADTTGQPAVAIVNETMARLYWPDGAVGRRFTLQRRFGRIDPLRLPQQTGETPITIVGVAHDSRQTRVLEASIREEFYLPLAQRPADARRASVVLRTKSDPALASPHVPPAL